MRITISLPDDLYKEIQRTAKENFRTVSSEIAYVYTQAYKTPPVFIAPDPAYPSPTPSPYKIICDIPTQPDPEPQPQPLGSITLPALINNQRDDAEINYYEHNDSITYNLNTNTIIPTSYIAKLFDEIETHNPENKPVLSQAERDIIDYMYNMYPETTNIDDLMTEILFLSETPEDFTTSTDKDLYELLQADADHRHRSLDVECDLIKTLYNKIY